MEQEIEIKIKERADKTTLGLMLVTIPIWFIWILFDYLFSPENLILFMSIRIVFGVYTAFCAWCLYKSKLRTDVSQYLLIFPPLATVSFMFNIVSENSLFEYYLGGTLVLIVAFLFLIVPLKRSVTIGLFALLTIVLFRGIFPNNSFILQLQNGGFLYASVTLFGIGVSNVRYRRIIQEIKNEILLEKANKKLELQKKELEEKNDLLSNSLKEKEFLLKEVHHRVKNNLQIITSLIKLQEDKVNVQNSTEILQHIQDRIRTMAIIHECLYKSGNFKNIHFREYVNELVNYYKDVYSLTENNISVSTDIADLSLETDKLIPCGLILNEAITNSIKHAFNHSSGKIFVTFNCINGENVLCINDNGMGFNKEDSQQLNHSLGLRLIKGLTQQLKGNCAIKSEIKKGTDIIIKFS